MRSISKVFTHPISILSSFYNRHNGVLQYRGMDPTPSVDASRMPWHLGKASRTKVAEFTAASRPRSLSDGELLEELATLPNEEGCLISLIRRCAAKETAASLAQARSAIQAIPATKTENESWMDGYRRGRAEAASILSTFSPDATLLERERLKARIEQHAADCAQCGVARPCNRCSQLDDQLAAMART